MSDQALTPPASIPPPLSAAAFSSGDWTNNTRQGVFSETHIFSPHVINEFRAGYTRLRTERLQFNSNDNLSSPDRHSRHSVHVRTMAACRVSASAAFPRFGSATYQPTREFENVYHFIENLSLIKGRQHDQDRRGMEADRELQHSPAALPARHVSVSTATTRATPIIATPPAWDSPISPSAYLPMRRSLRSSTTPSNSPAISSTSRTISRSRAD